MRARPVLLQRLSGERRSISVVLQAISGLRFTTVQGCSSGRLGRKSAGSQAISGCNILAGAVRPAASAVNPLNPVFLGCRDLSKEFFPSEEPDSGLFLDQSTIAGHLRS